MKLEKLTGAVVERSHYTGSDGAQRYSITVKEPGRFPSLFKFTTKDPGLFGTEDGFAAVGKIVTVDGFINSMEKTFQKKDGSQGKTINYWLTLYSIAPATEEAATKEKIMETYKESDPEDMPF